MKTPKWSMLIPQCLLVASVTISCATSPKQSGVRKVPPPPPMPPGLTNVIHRQSTARAASSFVPAAVVPSDRPIYIQQDPYFFDQYLIVALQKGGGNLEMMWADTLTGPWTFLAGYGYYHEDQYVVASFKKDWLPYHRAFICARNTPAAAPPAAALASARAAGTDTGRTLTVRGQKYKLILISPAGAQFRMYRLQL